MIGSFLSAGPNPQLPRADVVDVRGGVHALVEDLAQLAAALANPLEALEDVNLLRVGVVLEAWQLLTL
jgi:hypothetical protein